VTGWKVGDRVADLTMTGGYATHRLLEASRLTRVPEGVDPGQAAAVVLGGMTAYQLLHRHANVQRGQRVLIHGAAGSVGQMLLELGRLAGLEMYGTARAKHADLVASFGATPIDYQKDDFGKVVPDGYDVVFDGIGEAGFTKSWAAVKKGGFLSAYGFQAGVQTNAAYLTIGMWIGRIYLWNALPNGKRAGFYSISSLRKQHPEWFKEDLAKLFALVASGELTPRVAERIRLDDVADAPEARGRRAGRQARHRPEPRLTPGSSRASRGLGGLGKRDVDVNGGAAGRYDDPGVACTSSCCRRRVRCTATAAASCAGPCGTRRSRSPRSRRSSRPSSTPPSRSSTKASRTSRST
jgi:NADPH:quinone reductase-like Zn-dependent oxidoreductase